MFIIDIERFKALCALYFLNTIQPEELEELKSALNTGDEELRKIFNQSKKTVKDLPLFKELIDPPRSEMRNPLYKFFTSSKFERLRIKLAFLGICILFVSMSVLIFYTLQLFHEINNIKNNLNSQGYELESKDELLDVLQSREMLTINLKGQKIDPEGYGKVIWSPYTKKALLQIANLPATNKDFNYRIWLVNNNNYFILKADNKGSLDVANQNSENLFKINNLPIDNINKNYSFIITLEKQGSADNKPEGPIYLMGIF